MRQAIIALLLTLTLVLGLSGCGEDKTDKSDAEKRNYNEYNSNTYDNYGTNDNNGTNYNNGTNKDSNYHSSVGDDLKQETEDLLRGRSYDEMLRNGRVNDTDGFLNDGENHVSR